MLDSVRVSFDLSGDARRVLLGNIEGFVYDLWIVYYSLSQVGSQANDTHLRCALSTRLRDQAEDAIDVSEGDIMNDPSMMFPFTFFNEAPTDEGIVSSTHQRPIILVKPVTVSQLAVVVSESASSNMILGVEVHYESRQSSRESLFLAHRQRSLG